MNNRRNIAALQQVFDVCGDCFTRLQSALLMRFIG